MLLGLPSANESGVKVCDIDDQNRVVCLSSPCDHVRDEVPVTWRIEEYDVSIFQHIFLTPTSMVTPLALSYYVSSVTQANLNDYLPIYFDYIHYFSFLWICFFDTFMDGMHKLANKSWLSRVNVPKWPQCSRFLMVRPFAWTQGQGNPHYNGLWGIAWPLRNSCGH